MLDLGQLRIKITADGTQATGAINELRGTTDQLPSSASKAEEAFKRLRNVIIAAFSVKAIIDFGKTCIQNAADVEAANAAFSQTLGSNADKMTAKLQELGEQTGITYTRMTEATTLYYNKWIQAGFDADTAMTMTTKSLNLGADAAAYYNMSLEEANDHIKSFINGNMSAGDAIGISTNATTIASWAMEQLGIDYKNADEGQKQMIRQEYIDYMYNLAGVTGQATRESDSYENVMGNLREAWKQFTATVGLPLLEALIPILKAITVLLGGMAKVVEKVCAFFKEHQQLAAILGIALGALVTALIAYTVAQSAATIATTIATTATAAFGAVMAFVTAPITLVVLAIAALIAIIYLLIKNWDTISAKAQEVWEKVVQVFTNLWNDIVNIFNSIVEFLTRALENLKSFITNTITLIKDTIVNIVTAIWNKIVETFNNIKNTVETIMNAISTTISNIWNTIIGWFTNACQTIVNTITGIIGSVKTAATNVFNAIKNAFTSIWNSITGWFKNAVNFIPNTLNSIIGKARQAGSNIINGILNGLRAAWNGVVSFVNGIVDWLKDKLNFVGNIISKIAGSHRTGLREVPYDGYIAELHQGEMVLTAAEANQYQHLMASINSGAGTVGASTQEVNINLNIGSVRNDHDIEAITQELEKLRKKNFRVGGVVA